MIQGAIFDADGTLLDSMGMWDTVGERYLISQGVRPPAGLREALFPLSLAQCAVYLKDRFALPLAPSAIEAGINGVIRSFYAGEVVAKAGVLDFLRGLKAKGVPLYLATATDREVITKGLERTGILPLLDGLVTCGDLGVDKRTPDIFDYARDQMGTATEATWVFEDAVHAAATAAALTAQRFAHALQAGQTVAQQRQFGLQLALVGHGAAAEDLQDQHGAVDDFQPAQRVGNVADLAAGQLAVKHSAFRAQRLGGKGSFFQLAAAQHDAGFRGLALLGDLCHGLHVVGFAQGRKLCQTALAVPQTLIQCQQHHLCGRGLGQNIIKLAQSKSFLLS